MGAGARLSVERVERRLCSAANGHLRSRLEVLKWAREYGCCFVTAVTREPYSVLFIHVSVFLGSIIYLCFSVAAVSS